MRILYFLADTFISTFGITQPTEKARRQTAFFILGLVAIVIVGATSAFFILHSIL